MDTIFGQELEKYFNEFCIYGGYPEAAISNNAEEKKIILENIFKTYIEKDIIDLLRLEDDLALKNIVILLANRMANILEYSGLMTDSFVYESQGKICPIEVKYSKMNKPYFDKSDIFRTSFLSTNLLLIYLCNTLDINV